MEQIQKENPDWVFTFATEESFGYLNHPHVRDKDGVSSVALMAEMTLYYKDKGLTILQALEQIYQKYGFSNEELLSLDFFGKEGVDKMNRIMESFRKLVETKELAGQKLIKVSDYKKQKTWDISGQTQERIDLPASNVLGFFFENNDQLFLRPSGTEPKIKFYIMTQEEEGDLAQKREKCKQKTETLLAAINRIVEEA
jgi:phosphoglucomutase